MVGVGSPPTSCSVAASCSPSASPSSVAVTFTSSSPPKQWAPPPLKALQLGAHCLSPPPPEKERWWGDLSQNGYGSLSLSSSSSGVRGRATVRKSHPFPCWVRPVGQNKLSGSEKGWVVRSIPPRHPLYPRNMCGAPSGGRLDFGFPTLTIKQTTQFCLASWGHLFDDGQKLFTTPFQ